MNPGVTWLRWTRLDGVAGDAEPIDDRGARLRDPRSRGAVLGVTLAMLAHAFLAVVRAGEHTRQPSSNALIPLTRNEIQRLFIALVVQPVHDATHRLG